MLIPLAVVAPPLLWGRRNHLLSKLQESYPWLMVKSGLALRCTSYSHLWLNSLGAASSMCESTLQKHVTSYWNSASNILYSNLIICQANTTRNRAQCCSIRLPAEVQHLGIRNTCTGWQPEISDTPNLSSVSSNFHLHEAITRAPGL